MGQPKQQPQQQLKTIVPQARANINIQNSEIPKSGTPQGRPGSGKHYFDFAQSH
jgi:hypothetical protein